MWKHAVDVLVRSHIWLIGTKLALIEAIGRRGTRVVTPKNPHIPSKNTPQPQVHQYSKPPSNQQNPTQSHYQPFHHRKHPNKNQTNTDTLPNT